MSDIPTRTFDHRHITVQKTARYAVMGSFDAKLSEVWIVCHGHGQLAGRFLSRFTPLEREDRLLIAPEGLSRYYLDPSGIHGPDSAVGATWMTREDRDVEIADQARYLGQVYKEVFEHVDRAAVRLWVLGFSQGVATVARWLAGAARVTITADRVVFWAGMVPPELEAAGALALAARAPVTIVVGSADEFATPAVVAAQEAALKELGVPFKTQRFDGGHDLSDSALLELAATAG